MTVQMLRCRARILGRWSLWSWIWDWKFPLLSFSLGFQFVNLVTVVTNGRHKRVSHTIRCSRTSYQKQSPLNGQEKLPLGGRLRRLSHQLDIWFYWHCGTCARKFESCADHWLWRLQIHYTTRISLFIVYRTNKHYDIGARFFWSHSRINFGGNQTDRLMYRLWTIAADRKGLKIEVEILRGTPQSISAAGFSDLRGT